MPLAAHVASRGHHADTYTLLLASWHIASCLSASCRHATTNTSSHNSLAYFALPAPRGHLVPSEHNPAAGALDDVVFIEQAHVGVVRDAQGGPGQARQPIEERTFHRIQASVACLCARGTESLVRRPMHTGGVVGGDLRGRRR